MKLNLTKSERQLARRKGLLVSVCLGLFSASLFFGPAVADIDLEPGNPAPPFFLYDIDGREHFLSDFAGPPRNVFQKNLKRSPVIVNFFGVSCKPCEQELPYLKQLALQYKSTGLKIFLISKDPKFLLQPFVEKKQLGLTVLSDEYEQVFRKYLVVGIPMLYLIGPDGTILVRRFGFEQKDNVLLEAKLKKLM